MNYYDEIKTKLIKCEIYNRAKEYSKDRHKVSIYYEIGKLLSDAGKEYGKNIIKQYSEKLVMDVGKKYNERNLRYMRQFYEMILKTKWNALRSKLSWSHYRELLTIKTIDENDTVGIIICKQNNEYVIKYCSDERIISREYELV